MAIAFFLIAFVFAALWLAEIIPALLSGRAPENVTDTGLLTSPVHVLDLSFMLPAFAITAIMLLRRKPVAFILFPVLTVFAILMTIAVAGMMIVITFKGFDTNYVIAASFVATAGGCVVLLLRYFRV